MKHALFDHAHSERCFFAVENSLGYDGEPALAQLAQALEKAAENLAPMRLRVPLPWLHVHLELQRCATPHTTLRTAHMRVGARHSLACSQGGDWSS